MRRGRTTLRTLMAAQAPGYARPKDSSMSHMAGCTAASFSSTKPRICGAICCTSAPARASGALHASNSKLLARPWYGFGTSQDSTPHG